uniref:Flap endonuclease 1 n=1 Tax=Eucampia antarctica TaxID=49252 RepID=A0A7S2R6Z8_9STRA|mmetsp:Transcript_17937/g.17298  ORF Transcript_17937/g.17298 Transcript_17937/m.17298 type:complete len:394 (+) Transcript_17937:163-1344(+)|eukprot:CAMPEP_0197837238 /NCGR_PEP_ID=MMETSP1437-20131217/31531_1 /TAXON_ID=49252 ORGANISM="Eucampia antarctica, Strain CCMP1452" /NCGR_SAMPLE_ID=MMETSP1437 /ASSEMBLY_ACC=CAM_ASM_001096 /LENGTH=393 /DNA_ID=CAMNT_0043444115 /DNA_START=155 /DNA_END=1336 /DNA_ORIENTATION=+
MGIKGLAKLLSDEAPDSVREVPLSSLHGRKIAIDASMAIYQFLIAVRSSNAGNNASVMLTNEKGETTSHVQGFFNRTVRFLSEGIRPVFVFDGKPPPLKDHELTKRRARAKEATTKLKQAQEDGNIEEEEKQSKRLVRAGQKENEDCMTLLGLMGVPVVKAPCEAEAQAAAMAKAGSVHAVATEDMDALTFATPVLYRKMTFASGKADIQKLNYQQAIDGLNLSSDEFIDLCILLGCDYCDTIRGIGPKTALKLIQQHRTIEKILSTLDRKKYGVPDNWLPPTTATDEEKEEFVPIYVEARKMFTNHEVIQDVKLDWKPCQEPELRKYLVEEMGFNPDRVGSSIDKLQKAYKALAKPQTRMDSFFKVLPHKKKETTTKAAPKKKTTTAKKRRR